MIRTLAQALTFVRKHRVVPMTPAGNLPCFVSAVAGGPVKGSWWGHSKGALIYELANSLLDSPEVASLRLVDGKNTFVHRSLWPAFYRVVTDPAWRRSRMSDLNALGKRLASAVAKAGELRLDDWVRRHGDDPKAVKRARQRLTASLLLDGYNVHTETGKHAAVLVDWKRWAKADVKRAAEMRSFKQASGELTRTCKGTESGLSLSTKDS